MQCDVSAGVKELSAFVWGERSPQAKAVGFLRRNKRSSKGKDSHDDGGDRAKQHHGTGASVRIAVDACARFSQSVLLRSCGDLTMTAGGAGRHCAIRSACAGGYKPHAV